MTDDTDRCPSCEHEFKPPDGDPFCSSCVEAGWALAFRRGVRAAEKALGASGDMYLEQSADWLLTHFDLHEKPPPPEPPIDPLTVSHYGFPKR
jgi:hypothetical protein